MDVTAWISHTFSNFDWYTWVILPIIIFLARVADVSLGTMRIIFTSRGQRNLAPLFGFVEVFIWIVATSQLVKNVHGFAPFIGYAAGFAAGNFIGMWIEDRLAMGTLVLRVILPKGGDELVRQLHNAGYGATSVDGQGATGAVKLIYTIVKRANLKEVTNIIHQINSRAFVSIEEVRSTEQGIFPVHTQTREGALFGRKAK